MKSGPIHTGIHLSKRLWGSFRARPLYESEAIWVQSLLLEGEFLLWRTMDVRDQRHSFEVAQRFVHSLGGPKSDLPGLISSPFLEKDPEREAIAAALLHDVGKIDSKLSTLERVAVNIVGGRTERFRSYLKHEEVGLELCRQAGSTEGTLNLLRGTGDPRIQEQLRRADDI
jgi:hypothetical protein